MLDTNFNIKAPTKSLTEVSREAAVEALKAEGQPYDHLVKKAVSIELAEPLPDRKSKVHVINLSATTPRPDVVKQANIHYHENTFTEGVLDGDLSLSQMPRTPVADFNRMPCSPNKLSPTYFQPGQYAVSFDATRPRPDKSVPFDKQMARKPLRETVGRIEVVDRPTEHLPDRSLARKAGRLQNRCWSAPNLSKCTQRPPAAWEVRFHKPEHDELVLNRELAHDISSGLTLTRAGSPKARDFGKLLSRDQRNK